MAAGGITSTACRSIVIALALGEPALQQLDEAPGTHRQQGLVPAQLWGWWRSGALQAACHPLYRQLCQLLTPLLLGHQAGGTGGQWEIVEAPKGSLEIPGIEWGPPGDVGRLGDVWEPPGTTWM